MEQSSPEDGEGGKPASTATPTVTTTGQRKVKKSFLLLLLPVMGIGIVVVGSLYAAGILTREENGASSPQAANSAIASIQGDTFPPLQGTTATIEPTEVKPTTPPGSNSTTNTSLGKGFGMVPAISASDDTGDDENTEAVTSAPSTQAPTAGPTMAPTESPTAATTSSPTPFTPEYFAPNPVPDDPPRGYFNYDDDSRYGPSRWDRVNTQTSYMKEFGSDGFGAFKGHLAGKDPVDNKCDQDRNQSPKNLVRTTECGSHHEIRTKCSQKQLFDNGYTEKQILPHKLSLVFNRRPCLDPDDRDCEVGRPPLVDYPDYSSTTTPWSDLLNFDIKIPGEHTLEGESFDAEIQMLLTHLQPDPARLSSIGVPIRATPDGYNWEFQMILEEFQSVYDTNQRRCRRRRLRSGGDGNKMPSSSWNETVISDTERLLQSSNFDPFSYALMPGMFFYRYDGSMTEPPCMRLTWWVMSEPMVISHDQLAQMRRILFTNVDAETCEGTSVHNANQEVTRPIQPLDDDREIEKCDESDFIADIDKGAGEARRC